MGLSQNGIGPDVAAALKALDSQRQDYVMDGGFLVLSDADETVQTRIDRAVALESSSLDKYPDATALRNRVDEFITINDLDERARAKLESLSADDQTRVMDDDFLIHTRVDPSRGTASTLS